MFYWEVDVMHYDEHEHDIHDTYMIKASSRNEAINKALRRCEKAHPGVVYMVEDLHRIGEDDDDEE